ncbi:MAG: acid phosphatase [Chloroflexi bacterium]|nr:MAG: acid phosphatase [Chloroflexota bacterium]
MQGIWSNTALWVPVSAALFAQLLKPFWAWARNGRFDLRAVLSAGGMPSSHSAMVSSLATVLGFEEGLGSPLFAVAIIVALIVMYDARGVRQESGKQARILNRLVRELFSGQPISEEELKELLGHTAAEVAIGAIVGTSYALILLVLSAP